MLFRTNRNHFSYTENPKLNEFYKRPSKQDLKQILEAKRSQIAFDKTIKVPGRKSKFVILGSK